jgi:hypothetical protein
MSHLDDKSASMPDPADHASESSALRATKALTWKQWVAVPIFCIALVWLCWSPGGGLLLAAITPFALLWVCFSLFVMIRRVAQRRLQGLKLLAVLVTFIALFAVHQNRGQETQRAANEVAKKLTLFHQQHRQYPNHLTDIGIDDAMLRSDKRIMYRLLNDVPDLFYLPPFTFRAAYRFDFANQTWRYDPG